MTQRQIEEPAVRDEDVTFVHQAASRLHSIASSIETLVEEHNQLLEEVRDRAREVVERLNTRRELLEEAWLDEQADEQAVDEQEVAAEWDETTEGRPWLELVMAWGFDDGEPEELRASDLTDQIEQNADLLQALKGDPTEAA